MIIFSFRQVVTFQRILAFLIAFWIYSVGTTLSSFGNPLIHVQKLPWFTCVTLFLCLVTKIFFTLRHNQVQVQDHLSQGQPTQIMNMARYKRAVSSALWVTTTAVVCYLPYGVAETVILQEEMTLSIYLIEHFVITLVYLNSSLNPLLYCWKIREVRQAVKDTLRHLCCSPNR